MTYVFIVSVMVCIVSSYQPFVIVNVHIHHGSEMEGAIDALFVEVKLKDCLVTMGLFFLL